MCYYTLFSSGFHCLQLWNINSALVYSHQNLSFQHSNMKSGSVLMYTSVVSQNLRRETINVVAVTSLHSVLASHQTKMLLSSILPALLFTV